MPNHFLTGFDCTLRSSLHFSCRIHKIPLTLKVPTHPLLL
ncbi:hypothetical protein CLOSTMETH_03727 [[Clostridium] methylpentosum DSM 5476]|uniref:Uncharacterized protein n=1 Tax=[Clostridium] methylpentosum DSM 5476 TaxID=537013 RepID=C0EIN2_9FIRM|nr:hypothetical protein CLOSTMETH_03727 [[Clostridium] methylpentosum DSM 5476]